MPPMDSSTLFQSSVDTAVKQSVATQKPLFVFVTDGLPASAAWLLRCLSGHSVTGAVTLRLEKGSTECGLFEQAFGVVETPTFHVIRMGQPLETVGENTLDEEMEAVLARLEGQEGGANSNLIHREESTTPITVEGSVSPAPTVPAETPISTPAVPPVAHGVPNPVLTPTLTPTPTASGTPIVTPTAALATRASTLKELAAESAATHYRQQQARERANAVADKKRILSLLASDKEERRLAAQRPHDAAAAALDENPKEILRPKVYTTCALHIKLLNGATLTGTFKPSETLAAVREWVDENRDDGDRPYTFAKAVPRLSYGDGDELRSLAQLDLLPRLALLLKAVEEEPVEAYSANGGWFRRAATAVLSYWHGDDDILDDEFVDEVEDTPLEAPPRASSPFASLLMMDPGAGLGPQMLGPLAMMRVSSPSIRLTPMMRLSSLPNFSEASRTRAPEFVRNDSGLRIRTLQDAATDRFVYNGNQLDLEDDEEKEARRQRERDE